VIVSRLPYPLTFSTRDLAPRPIEELANHMRLSRAFLRLCESAGAPFAGGHSSPAKVLLWLFDHYEDVRAVAGLRELAAVEGLSEAATARLRMANALATILEFSRSRATNWMQKRQLRRALEKIAALGDRGA